MNATIFKRVRLKKKLTQKEFGNLLGVSESTIAAIEKGRRPISDQVRARLVQNIEIDDDLVSFLDSFRKIDYIIPN